MTTLARYFEAMWGLALVPVLTGAIVVLLVATARRRAVRLARMGQSEVVARLVPPTSQRPSRLRLLCLGLAAACATVAFAGPRWGVERTVVRSSGADIVLALDASLSMLAADERPDRLARMKQEARRILASSAGDRVGLIAFAGRSYILAPPTVDHGAVSLFLDNLDPSVVGQAGSSLARTIRQGTELLTLSKSGSDRALVVMSDGESFEPQEDVVAAAERAGSAGVALVLVGFGTANGATIPVATAEGTVPKRDETGAVVITRYTPALLQAAATASRGTFIDAAATDKATRVVRAVATLRRTQGATDSSANRRPRFQLFLLPALLLALADTLLAERRGRRRRGAAAATTAAAASLFLLLLPPAQAGAAPGPGDDLYRSKKYLE
ncbi:MAG: VWA domain-containing protein, partial [Gemmatimonadaceae bacterium]